MIDRLSLVSGASGGTERQVVDMLNALDKCSFRPILICSQQLVATPLWDEIQCEKHLLNLFTLISWKGIKTLFWLKRLFRRESVDIVITYFIDSTLLGVIAARLAGVKYIVSTRRDMGYWYDRKITLLLRFVNLMTTRILTNSQAVKRRIAEIERVNLNKVDVICNGINISEVDGVAPLNLCERYSGIQMGDDIVGLVANFGRTVKRVDLFLTAAATVLKRHPRTKFVIIGGGRLESELRRLTEILAIKDQVIFAGMVHHTAAFVKNFNVGVSCSDSEGLSNSIIEYMTARVPCVATSVGGTVELLQHMSSGILVPPGNPDALADAIMMLLGDRCLAARLAKKARSVIEEHYDWSVRIREIEHYCKQLPAMT